LSRTVVISDIHIGYEKFNKQQFEQFLNYLEKEDDVSHVILLGDIFDLWRADPINSISYAFPYMERLKKLGEIHYVIGNHDYHNYVSCLILKETENFLGMKIHYPYYILNNDIFLTHGDYFDIHMFRIVEKAIYAVYEAIYYAYEPVIRILEKYFYNPLMLLEKWIKLYKRKPELAKKHPYTDYIQALINIESKQEINTLQEGLKYLRNNPDVAIKLFVPAYLRPELKREMPALLRKRMKKETKEKLKAIDTSAFARTLLIDKDLVGLAREISGNNAITKVIYGHTHKAENGARKGCWNTGSWVEGESTFVEIIDRDIRIYRFKDGQKIEISETS
jgi:UDP-2,3-diacylglucosamine pyrophosphatase LpxH